MPYPGRVDTGVASAALAELCRFRLDLYDCFSRRADGLFEVVDALAGADTRLRAIAELSLEPVGSRGWGAHYQALNHGVIDVSMTRDLLAGRVDRAQPVRQAAHGRAGWPLIFAVDPSVVPRPDTTIVDGIGRQYLDHRDGAVFTVEGWLMSWLCQVGELNQAGTRTSWVQPVDVRQIPFGTACTEVAVAMFTDLITRLNQHPDPGDQPAGPPLLLADAGHCPITMTQHLPAGGQILVALRSNRVFYGRPPARTGRRGRPAVHGPRFAQREPDTWHTPDATYQHTTTDGATVHTQAWHHLHPEPSNGDKQPWHGIIEGTLIRQETHRPGRRTLTRWLWWAGPETAFNLSVLAQAYPHRFTIEHFFRYAKQDLFWTGHTPHTAAQAERWAWIIALTYTQLHLARPAVADHPTAWRKPQPPDQISPRRVRRDFRRVCATLPSPTKPPKNTHPGPGRPKGSKNLNPRPLQPVHTKGKPTPTGRKPGRPRKQQPTKT